MTDLHRLPDGWDWVSVEDVADVIPGNSPPSSTYNESGDGLPFYQGKSEFGDLYPTPEKWCSEPKKIAEQDDVLVSVRAPVGPTNLCPDRSCIGRGLAAIRPREDISSRYVLWAIRARESELAEMGTGTTFDSVTSGELRSFMIPLAPDQVRNSIVAKIEELFSNLDAGLENLATAERQLERYRLSVLQAAVEGRLTAGWRRTHNPEPADQLLEKILKERRTQWEADYRMRRYEVKGKEPPSGWRERYDPPEPPDEDKARRDLPNDWRWVTVDQLSPNIHYGYTESATEEPVGPKFLRISDIQDGKVNWGDVPYCEIGGSERRKYLLSPGDIVFARTGGTVGKSYLVRDDVPEAVFASYLIRVITVESFEEDYLYLFFQTLDYWRQISERKTGIGQPNVNATKLSELVLPLPPLPEQRRIVDEVERLLSVSEDGLKTVNRETGRAKRLRQSILRKAFSGRLL